MPNNGNKDPVIEYHCAKLTPWNHVPPQPGKEVIVHDDAEELYPDCDCSLVTFKCPNCGHIYTLDLN